MAKVGPLGCVFVLIKGLRKLEQALTTRVSECAGGDIPDCPIIDTLFAHGGH